MKPMKALTSRAPEISDDILRWQCGKSFIELHRDGEIIFANQHSAITLSSDGKIQLQGVQLINYSEEDIKLTAGKNIHLNSV